MLLLANTSSKVQVVTGSAGDIEVCTDYADVTGTPQVVTPVPNIVASIVTATTTDVVGSPASSTQRNVKGITIRNKDASISNAIRVLRYDGTNTNDILPGLVTLLPGEAMVFDERGTWTYLASDGTVKSYTSRLNARLRVISDVTNATTSFADITGLTTPLLSGKKYGFTAHLYHQTNATTTGAQFGVNIGATPTAMNLAAIQQITASVTAATFGSSAMVTAVDTAAVVETTGPGAVNMLAIVSGYIQPSADGTFAMRCKSEVAVAGGLVIKAGSWLHIFELDN